MRRITQGLVLLLVLGLSVGLMSCSGDDDDEDISGVFQGTITDNTGLSIQSSPAGPPAKRDRRDWVLYAVSRNSSGHRQCEWGGQRGSS